VGKTPVQTVHADFPHTAYQVVVEVAALRGPRILNGSTQAVESQGLEEGTTPPSRATRAKATARTLDQQGVQPLFDIRVDLDEFRRRIARAKVLSPAAEHGIQVRDDAADILMAPRAGCQCSHAGAHRRHGALRRTPMQVEDALPRPLPDRPAHALAQMAPEEVEAVASTREVDRPRLLRMELEPESREHEAHASSCFLDVRLRVTHHHEVVGVADQCADMRTPRFPHAVEDMQIDVREQW
jgi:hypothetical protein